MFIGAITALALLVAPAPLLELDIAPGYSGQPCLPLKLVEIRPDGSLQFRGKAVERTRLIEALGPLSGDRCDRVYIEAHEQAPYGVVFSLIGMLKSAGFKRIALIDKPWGAP